MEQKGYFDQYSYQFSTYVGMGVQEFGSKFSKAVMHQALKGRAAEVADIIQQTDAVPDVGYEQDTMNLNIEHERRWLTPRNNRWGTLVDRRHSLDSIADPTSQYVRSGALAMGRAKDDTIIRGIFGSNFVGKDISAQSVTPTLMSYNGGSQVIASDVGASSATGMNVDKILAVKELLQKNGVDLDTETCYMGLCAKQMTELSQDVRFTSRDFVSSTILDKNGIPTSFAGINFILSERLPGGSQFNSKYSPEISGYETEETYLLPFWTTSGVLLGTWEDLYVSISKIPTKYDAWQIFLDGTWGATRLEEKRCGVVVCSN